MFLELQGIGCFCRTSDNLLVLQIFGEFAAVVDFSENQPLFQTL
jgi:hypothetical protein